jgi:hypothetical protein
MSDQVTYGRVRDGLSSLSGITLKLYGMSSERATGLRGAAILVEF